MFNKTESRYGTLEMILAMVLMGTVGYFVVESGQKAHNVVFFRCLLGIVFLAIYGAATGLFKNTGLTIRSVYMIILSGIFLILNWIMLFASFKLSSISTATVIYHIQPFFFVLIGALFLHETVSLDKILWMVLAFMGVILVANLEILDIKNLSFTSTYIIGLILAIL